MRSIVLFIALVGLTACSSSSAAVTLTSTGVARQLPVVALPGFQVSEFVRADSRVVVSNPDSIAVDGQNVFIDYQNVTAKDCTDQTGAAPPYSTVVQYDIKGKILGHWNVQGHSDGMRVDPSTHLVWTTSCEDGNALFATIDPSSGKVTPYAFPATPHGGGFDDLYFLNGSVFVAASNPTTDSSGANPNPAIYKIALGSDGKTLTLTSVLKGNAMATDVLSPSAPPAPLTLTDPDSMSVDSSGQLVLFSQADSVLVFIKNPGTPQQSVSKMAVGSQLEDTVWPSGPGRLLVVDGGGSTYWISGTFAKGDIYTQTPNDSGIDNFVATIASATGFETPMAIGFQKATGMVFVPNS